MAYLPNGGTVTVDLSTIEGNTADVWWYDPENGKSKFAGNFPAKGSQKFTSPVLTNWLTLGPSDWVLVVDKADLGFPAPGGRPDDGSATTDSGSMSLLTVLIFYAFAVFRRCRGVPDCNL